MSQLLGIKIVCSRSAKSDVDLDFLLLSPSMHPIIVIAQHMRTSNCTNRKRNRDSRVRFSNGIRNKPHYKSSWFLYNYRAWPTPDTPHQIIIIVVGAHYRPFSLKQHPFLGATCVHVSHCPSGAAVRKISSACVHSSSQRLQFIDWMILKKCLCRSVGLLSSKRITKFNINMYHHDTTILSSLDSYYTF